jgi:hypothetical protein
MMTAAELKRLYVKSWQGAFVELLGCPAEFADELRAYNEDCLNDPDSVIYTNEFAPLSWIAPLIVEFLPVEGLTGCQFNVIEDKVHAAILGGQGPLACSRPDFDWQAAAKGLDEYLRQRFGTTLAELRGRLDPNRFYYRRSPAWSLRNKKQQGASPE